MNLPGCTFLLIFGVTITNNKANGIPLEDNAKVVTKRSLKNFGAMLECETNHSKWSFNGYGCWCGYGGSGEPLDGVDWCCYEHDKCYGEIMAGSECTTSADPYIVSYKVNGCSDCAPASEYTTWDSIGWASISCRRSICMCDSAAAKCFSKNVYHHSLADYDKSQCDKNTHA